MHAGGRDVLIAGIESHGVEPCGRSMPRRVQLAANGLAVRQGGLSVVEYHGSHARVFRRADRVGHSGEGRGDNKKPCEVTNHLLKEHL